MPANMKIDIKEEILEKIKTDYRNGAFANEHLRRKQDELDEKVGICPKCGKKEKWGLLREWENCGECMAKETQR